MLNIRNIKSIINTKYFCQIMLKYYDIQCLRILSEHNGTTISSSFLVMPLLSVVVRCMCQKSSFLFFSLFALFFFLLIQSINSNNRAMLMLFHNDSTVMLINTCCEQQQHIIFCTVGDGKTRERMIQLPFRASICVIYYCLHYGSRYHNLCFQLFLVPVMENTTLLHIV